MCLLVTVSGGHRTNRPALASKIGGEDAGTLCRQGKEQHARGGAVQAVHRLDGGRQFWQLHPQAVENGVVLTERVGRLVHHKTGRLVHREHVVVAEKLTARGNTAMMVVVVVVVMVVVAAAGWWR